MIEIVSTIAAVLLDTVVPIYLAVTVTVILAFIYDSHRALVPALILGLVTDIAAVSPLGLSSVVLVVLAMLIIMGRQQFEWTSPLVLFGAAALGEVGLLLVHQLPVVGWRILVQAVVATGIYMVMMRVQRREGVYLK